jgi:hypothetical protein
MPTKTRNSKKKSARSQGKGAHESHAQISGGTPNKSSKCLSQADKENRSPKVPLEKESEKDEEEEDESQDDSSDDSSNPSDSSSSSSESDSEEEPEEDNRRQQSASGGRWIPLEDRSRDELLQVCRQVSV